MAGLDRISAEKAEDTLIPPQDTQGLEERRASLAALYGKNQVVPDVLDTIAHISDDRVFTPPTLVSHILDALPPTTWSNPNLKILDPVCKTGVFLRECARRFMLGLTDSFPDAHKRREHILRNMLYGLAVDEITSLMSRRTLYCASDATRQFNPKKPENCHSAVIFERPEGNILFPKVEHKFHPQTGLCSDCGVSKSQYDRGADLESYAYPFLHIDLAQAFPNMKFNIIIGNPPYQMNDGEGGNGSSAIPLYQKFIERAKTNDPDLLSFVIPARWYADGKGLDDFRKAMRTDTAISLLVDIPDSGDAFPGVEIKGGVCYFVRKKGHNGPTLTKTLTSGKVVSEIERDLSEFDVILRREEAARILRKVQSRVAKDMLNTLETFVSARKPFGLLANFKNFESKPFDGAVQIYANKNIGWVSRDVIAVNQEWIDKQKVIVSKAYGAGESYPHQITGKPIVASTPSCCTETYLVVRILEDEEQAQRFAAYMRTKIFRFLVSTRKTTQNMSRDKFKFVPDLPMTQEWDDEKLAAYFGLDEEDMTFISSMVREMTA